MANVHPNRIYEDFNPPTEMISAEGYDFILVFLPGFKEEQLKVQFTPSRVLQISGERLTSEKEGKWLRFQKEFTITPNCDTNDITTKFLDGVLYIIQPKLIATTIKVTSSTDIIKGKSDNSPIMPMPELQPFEPRPQLQQQPPIPSDFHKEERKGLSGSAPEEESQTMRKTGIPDPSPMPMPMQMENPTLQPFEPRPQLQQQPPIPSDFHKEEEKGLSGSAPDQLLKQGDPHSDSDLFNWLVVSVLMVLIVGFYILQMFKSFTG